MATAEDLISHGIYTCPPEKSRVHGPDASSDLVLASVSVETIGQTIRLTVSRISDGQSSEGRFILVFNRYDSFDRLLGVISSETHVGKPYGVFSLTIDLGNRQRDKTLFYYGNKMCEVDGTDFAFSTIYTEGQLLVHDEDLIIRFGTSNVVSTSPSQPLSPTLLQFINRFSNAAELYQFSMIIKDLKIDKASLFSFLCDDICKLLHDQFFLPEQSIIPEYPNDKKSVYDELARIIPDEVLEKEIFNRKLVRVRCDLFQLVTIDLFLSQIHLY
jgi:hypothetical protein